MSLALSVSDVSKRFGDIEALHEVSFEADPGEVVAIVGPNGAGKTTLLSIIAGTQHQNSGSVSGPGSRRAAAVGWVPQQPALYSKLSVAENLRLFARLEKVGDPEGAVDRMLGQTGLEGRADERVERLSGGNRQRVNVAIGLIADPPVLALDEPSAALDPSQRERLWEFLCALAAAGTSIVFSTHTVHEARRYAGRVIVLDEGQLLFDGAPQELMERAQEPADGDFERALVRFLAQRRRP